jgi:iron complex transport system permease protein
VVALAIALVVAWIVAICVGAFRIPPDALAGMLLAPLGLADPDSFTAQQQAVFGAIRLPRTVLAILAGAGLALSGAVLQGLFRNPLAESTVIGVSSGAMLGAALAIVAGHLLPVGLRTTLGPITLPLAAFACALGVTLTVWRFGRSAHGTSVASMLLAGIAFNAIAFAGVGFLSVMANDEQLRNLTFWNLGSVGIATWHWLAVVAPVAVVAGVVLLRLAVPLNALALGATEAAHLGIDVARLERTGIVVSALVVGVLVSLTGVIGFVGLLAPHAVRLACGPDHRVVLPGAALLGATLLLVADACARTWVAPAELPVGVFTTFIGAPFFLWLLARAKRSLALGG